jgi:PAS domain S-box-containing protein
MSHYAFNWFALPPIITALCSLAVGMYVLRRDWTSRLAEAVFAGTAALSVWLGGFGLMYLAADESTAFLWARVAYYAVPLLPGAIYLYITIGLRHYQREKALVWVLLLTALAFVGLTHTTRLLISGVERHWWGYYAAFGPAGPYFVAYFGFVIVLGLAKLRSRLRDTPKKSVFYRRIAMSFLGSLAASVAAIDFLPGFGLPVYPVGYVAVLLFLAMILAMEKRHRFVCMTPAVAAGQILSTMQGVVLLATPEGSVEVSNQAASELLGYSESEFLELSLSEVFESETEWRELLGNCLAVGKIRDRETSWRQSNGCSADVSISASLLTDDTGQPLGVVLAAIDITSRKKAEAALRETEEHLRQSQKMEAVGQLAGGIAHDFNNLLTAIIGNSTLALDNMASEDPNRELIADIREVGERAASLTRQILAFSRRQMLKPKILCLNAVVLDLEPLLRRSLGEHIELEFLLTPDLRETEIDPHQIGQVLLNLAVNARDAMPQGGRLLIETANASLDAEYCRTHPETKPGEHVMLAVSDNGCGIDKEAQARLFEPFFTTKEAGKGTGLGLSTAFGIVKQSGGSISVYSEPGEGSTFKVYMPVAGASAPSVTESAHRQQDSRPGSASILVVEDEVPVRTLVVRVLSRAGYQVKAAGSAQEADTVLAGEEYHPDLLLTDVVLPGGANGRQVAQALLERYPLLRVIFMSGYTRNAVVHDGRVDEDIAFLEKPFNPEMLLRMVREVLDA